jgi:hypothetical protein
MTSWNKDDLHLVAKSENNHIYGSIIFIPGDSPKANYTCAVVCNLFNDAFSNSDYWTGKDVEGSGRGLIYGIGGNCKFKGKRARISTLCVHFLTCSFSTQNKKY